MIKNKNKRNQRDSSKLLMNFISKIGLYMTIKIEKMILSNGKNYTK